MMNCTTGPTPEHDDANPPPGAGRYGAIRPDTPARPPPVHDRAESFDLCRFRENRRVSLRFPVRYALLGRVGAEPGAGGDEGGPKNRRRFFRFPSLLPVLAQILSSCLFDNNAGR